MKLFAFLFVLMTSSMAFSAETLRIVEDEIPNGPFHSFADAKFYMDTDSSLGYAQVSVREEFPITYWETICSSHPRHPAPVCHRVPRTRIEYRTVYEHTELIPNLVLEGNKMVYHGENSTVECGTLGTSRVFRKPTLYLNGKCKLNSRVLLDRSAKKVVVDFQVL